LRDRCVRDAGNVTPVRDVIAWLSRSSNFKPDGNVTPDNDAILFGELVPMIFNAVNEAGNVIPEMDVIALSERSKVFNAVKELRAIPDNCDVFNLGSMFLILSSVKVVGS